MLPAFSPCQATVAGTFAIGNTLLRLPCRVSAQPPGGAVTLVSKGDGAKGDRDGDGVGAATIRMRRMPPGFILPVTDESLLTSFSGQLGLNVPVVPLTLTVPQVSGAPFAVPARMSDLPSAAICRLEYTYEK